MPLGLSTCVGLDAALFKVFGVGENFVSPFNSCSMALIVIFFPIPLVSFYVALKTFECNSYSSILMIRNTSSTGTSVCPY